MHWQNLRLFVRVSVRFQLMVNFLTVHIPMQPSFKSETRLLEAAPSYVEAESEGSLFEAAGSSHKGPSCEGRRLHL